MHTTHTQRNGFTSVELMVVVALVGILTTIFVINFRRNVEEERLKSVSREISSVFMEIKNITRQRSKHCELKLNYASALITVENSSECTGIGNSVDLKATVDNITQLKICGRTGTDPDDHTFACDNNNDGSEPPGSTESTFVFTARGTVSQGGILKLYLPGAERTRCIAVLPPIGLIREGRDNGSGCDFTING